MASQCDVESKSILISVENNSLKWIKKTQVNFFHETVIDVLKRVTFDCFSNQAAGNGSLPAR